MKIAEFRELSTQLADPNPFFVFLSLFEANVDLGRIDLSNNFIVIYNNFVRSTHTIDGGGNTIANAELEFLFMELTGFTDTSEQEVDNVITRMRQQAYNYVDLIDKSDIISTNIISYTVENIYKNFDKNVSGALLRVTVPIDAGPNIC